MVVNVDECLILVGYVKSSSYRVKVINVFREGLCLTPTEISALADIRVNHISTVLKELSDKQLLECINPNAHKGRLYRLTSKGIQVKNELDKNNRFIISNDEIMDTVTGAVMDIETLVETMNNYKKVAKGIFK